MTVKCSNDPTRSTPNLEVLGAFQGVPGYICRFQWVSRGFQGHLWKHQEISAELQGISEAFQGITGCFKKVPGIQGGTWKSQERFRDLVISVVLGVPGGFSRVRTRG